MLYLYKVKAIKLRHKKNKMGNFNDFTGEDWAEILIDRPDLANQCEWAKLDSYDWRDLLMSQPQLAKYCEWNKINGADWALLLIYQPQLASFCDWNKLNVDNWEFLVRFSPEFAKHKKDKMKDSNELTREDWAEMLTARPELSSFQDWQTLDIDNWEVFFRFRPEFVKTEIDTKAMMENIEVLERINFAINHFRKRKKNFETHLIFQNLENVVKKHEHKIEIFKMCIKRLKQRHNKLLIKMKY